jgi:4-amino-4-deoxy-L-arabinose transferase-like glycosyltransferase
VLLVVVALAALFAAWRSGRWWQWALGGFTFGLAVQVRPNLLVLFGGFALGLAWALRRQRRPWLLPLAVCSAALVLAVVPWTVRNHRVHDRWFFVSTGGGRQFWFGNNEQTSGSTRVHPEPDAEMWADLERLPNDFEKEAFFYRKGAEFVRAHPARAAWLYLVKLGNLYALYPDTKSRTYINLWSEWAQSLASVVIYIGALLGLRRWRSEPPLWPMVAGIVTFTAVNALYFSCMRYRMAFEPMLMLMAGLGWAGVVAGRRAAAIATPGRA